MGPKTLPRKHEIKKMLESKTFPSWETLIERGDKKTAEQISRGRVAGGKTNEVDPKRYIWIKGALI